MTVLFKLLKFLNMYLYAFENHKCSKSPYRADFFNIFKKHQKSPIYAGFCPHRHKKSTLLMMKVKKKSSLSHYVVLKETLEIFLKILILDSICIHKVRW